MYLLMFGFRLWKITSGIIGFFFGFLLCFLLVFHLADPNTPSLLWIALGSAIGAGLLVGLLLFLFPVVALVCISIIVGFALGIVLYNIAFVHTNWPYAWFISVGVSGLVVMILALLIKKTFLVMMTSFCGAFAIAFGINVYVGGFPIFPENLLAAGQTMAPLQPTWVAYIYFAGILAGTFVGIILQFCIFARGISWDQVRKRVCPRNDKYSDELGTPLMETGKKSRY